MAITQSYVDPVGGSDLADGSLATPWATLQWAFDHCVRNATDGNQINLKITGAHVNAAALDLTTFIAGGALSAAVPLIVRGYTAAANDGGIGEINANGATLWAASTYDYVYLVDLKAHNFGNNNGIVFDDNCILHHCEVHKGASSPSGKALVTMDVQSVLSGSYIHDAGTNGIGIITNGSVSLTGNYFAVCPSICHQLQGNPANAVIRENIMLLSATGSIGVASVAAGQYEVVGNIFYNTAAGTAQALDIDASRLCTRIMNNIACGFSGAGGKAFVDAAAAAHAIVGYNAFWNNTANYSFSDVTHIDLTANDVILVADPFTNAAAGDFSLTAAGRAALRGLGWPAAYLGAHINTDGHITVGPIQYGEAPIGYPAIADVRLGVIYGESNEYTGTFAGGGAARGVILGSR